MSPSDKAKNSREEQSNPGVAKRISQNPWFQITLFIIAIVSIGMTIFIYLTSQEKRELVYAINPVYTTVASAQQASALEITYQGAQLGKVDINAVQVAIWNMGKQSIKSENVLEPIIICTNPPVRILEASVSKYSRDVIGFKVDGTQQTQAIGRVPVSWRILERNDGASIQLIYVGPSKIDISIEGVIEGLNVIKPVDLGVKIKSPSEQIESKKTDYWISIAMFAMAVFLLILIVWGLILTKNLKKRLDVGELIRDLIFATMLIVFAILTFPKATWPPFGF